MKKRTVLSLYMCAALAAAAPATTFAEAIEAETEETERKETEAAEAEESNQLSVPTDFVLDPNTGEWSFQASDERVGYYFVRFYLLEDGVEAGQYVASSKRINGGKAGEFSGKIDLSDIAWGDYHVNLTSFAPAGTDYVSPEPVSITVHYGVDLNLERPEFLVMTSGNTVECVVDWWTLCDYNFEQYMPNLKFTFYTDEALTEEAFSDTVDLNELVKTRSMNPPGMEYIWGWSTAEGPHFYTIGEEPEEGEEQSMFGGGQITMAFKNDIYTYTLDAGTYYVTAQALSKDEYTRDSQVTPAVEITVEDGECTEEYTAYTSELWTDPQVMDMPGANPGQQPDRIDTASEQGISAKIIE